MTNAAEPKAVKARNRRERREMDRHQAAVRAVWGTSDGRRYCWGLMGFARFLQTPMTGNAYTEFNCGMQNVALRMFADVQESCPDLFLLAMEEAKRTQTREEAEDLALSPTPEKEDTDA